MKPWYQNWKHMEFMVIVHLYSGGRTGTYQRGFLPDFTRKTMVAAVHKFRKLCTSISSVFPDHPCFFVWELQ